MKKVIVGVPVYKSKLLTFEKIALAQLKKILGNYEIVFIAPHSLNITYDNNIQRCNFDDKYFFNRENYSELLLSESFYKQFTNYEYLLIYQLDAFVFKDELMKFCDMGYDYIGAPITGGDWHRFHVGNGGLSLRNIKKTIAMVRCKDEIKKKMLALMDIEYFAEDLFFSYCGYDKEIDFCVPSSRLASTFSAEMDYAHGLRDISKRGLPFGCHYWPKMNYDFWKRYIESYDYTLPNISSVNTLHTDTLRRTIYLLKRYVRNKRWNRSNDYICNFLKQNKRICIFGAGKLGRESMAFFTQIPGDHKINKFFDSKVEGEIFGIKIVKFDKNVFLASDEVVIIATVKFEKEIIASLEKYGLINKKNIYSISRMIYNDYGVEQQFMGENYVKHA